VKTNRAVAEIVEDVGAGVGNCAVEDMILFDVVEEFRAGIFNAALDFAFVGIVDFEAEEAIGASIGKRLD
jgi:hypothetical protein